jgi:hypothetical protein
MNKGGININLAHYVGLLLAWSLKALVLIEIMDGMRSSGKGRYSFSHNDT